MLKLNATLRDNRVTASLDGEATAQDLTTLTCGTVEAILEIIFERNEKEFDKALEEISAFVRALKGE